MTIYGHSDLSSFFVLHNDDISHQTSPKLNIHDIITANNYKLPKLGHDDIITANKCRLPKFVVLLLVLLLVLPQTLSHILLLGA
jgi:hypothetical protein